MTDEEKEAIEYIKNCLDNEYNFKNATRQKDKKAYNIILNLIEKQSKEIEELKEEDDANLAYYDQIYQNGIYTGQKAVEDKIKAKIEEYKEKCKNCNFRGKICNEFIKNYECTIGVCLKEFYSLLEKE